MNIDKLFELFKDICTLLGLGYILMKLGLM